MTTDPQPQPRPADELRAAAFQLRNPFHLPGLKVAVDPDLAAPLADWLDAAADDLDALPFPVTDRAALAVARALSGPCPHCHGGLFRPHSHELPGRRP